MKNDSNSARSGEAAAIFFTALSSTTALAAALLPFVLAH
jgi:hypothetical protein